MKKFVLVILTIVPVVYGYIFNSTVKITILINLFFYVLSPALLVLWFILGKNYSKTNWNWFVSLLISHFVGFLSIVLYFWQFYFVSDETRNILIAGFSQMFTSCTYLISGKIAALFKPEYNNTKLVMSLMQAIGLVLMITTFLIGYFYGKKKKQTKL